MFATQVLSETVTDDDSREGDNSGVIGYLSVGEKKYEVKKGETKIGRDSSMCAIVIEDFAVSKVHAVIESEGIDDTFIYDFGSTNQTKLGKKVLKPHCRYKLDDESTLTLGNITAKFTLPPDKIASETSKFSSAKSNLLDELEDIFELVTQVTTPDTNSSKISVFEKPANTKAFDTPSVILPPKELSKNNSNEVTSCYRLDSKETKTGFQHGLLGNSCIFNANTQCQLYEPQTHIKCEEETVSESKEDDEVKSFLDDGQDDVLCQFISLNSTKEYLKEIKTEVVNSSYEAFNASTEIQPVIQKPLVQKVGLINSSNNSLEKDFLNKPSITSTPLISKIKSSHSEVSNNSTQQLEEEDSIKTQRFDAEVEKSIKESENVSHSQDEETQLYLCETLDNSPTFEQIKNDEDVILTQKFNAYEQSTTVIPESEDFMATQIYDVDKERLSNITSAKETTPPEKLSENSALENNLDKTSNVTQRSNQDDFVETQVFEDTNDKNLDEEDFIETQRVETPVDETHKNALKSNQRESSPDLLDFENSKDNEDFISTQLFEAPQGQASSNVKSPERTDTSLCEKGKSNCSHAKTDVSVTAESSGDETESDLEIILDKTEAGELSRKSFKTESENESNTQPQNVEVEDNDTNSSYIFERGAVDNEEEAETKSKNQEQGKVADMSDSDETDCEEIAVFQNHPVKQEPIEKIEFEETQVLTLTPLDYNQAQTSDDFWPSEESPKFESGIESSSRTLESNVETIKVLENESAVVEDYQIPSKIKKTEVGVSDAGSAVSNSEREVNSPLKRPLDSKSPDVVPIKKSKTEVIDRLLRSSEKKLLRLVQTHDIAQIQPSRTRNSIKTLTTENSPNPSDIRFTNEHPSSRRKNNPKKQNPRTVNGDIKPYLTSKKVESRRTSDRTKETSPKDKKTETQTVGSSRILRSSRRNSGNATSSDSKECSNRSIPVRKPRRLFRNKNEYFKSSCINIVFTGFGCDSLEKIISDLGGEKADDLSCGEVVVADKVRRTVKFLCAIGLGLPITSPEWLLSSKKEQRFLNPWNFILKDEVSEEKYNFELKTSLERSKRVKLLEGFSVYATRSTKPPVKDLLAIVESCGGTPILKPPDIWPKKTIIVSCLEDKQSWPLPKYRNVKIVHYEFILGGVLRQKIDFKTYQLR